MTMLFLCAIVAVLTLGVAARALSVTGTAIVLLLNWVSETAFYGMTGDQHAWMLYIVVDYLSALALVTTFRSKWQIVVIAIYAIQIVMHVGYGISDMTDLAANRYWWALTFSGWAQLAVVAGGGVACLIHSLRHGRGGSLATPSAQPLGRKSR